MRLYPVTLKFVKHSFSVLVSFPENSATIWPIISLRTLLITIFIFLKASRISALKVGPHNLAVCLLNNETKYKNQQYLELQIQSGIQDFFINWFQPVFPMESIPQSHWYIHNFLNAMYFHKPKISSFPIDSFYLSFKTLLKHR